MMVPEMLGDLMRIVVETDENIRTVFDPFAGAGTVMTEAMLLGLDFVAQDVNPLAVLLCKAKAGPLRYGLLNEIVEDVKRRVRQDALTRIDCNFPNRTKWFADSVSIELSRIRRSISKVTELWCRRFLWVAVAETVRLCSNSRTSTFKLHIRPAAEISTRKVSAIAVFEQVLERNLESLQEFRTALEDGDLLRHGCYSGRVTVKRKDGRSMHGRPRAALCDLLVTSPPYGDNTTTVPYGQHSYLPLQWIDLADIGESVDESCLSTTHEIDRLSLGGSRKDAIRQAKTILATSPSFARFLRSIQAEPRDRHTRAAAFIRDLDACIDPLLRQLRRDAYMIWVVGNRRIGGQLLPTDAILCELLHARKAKLIERIDRKIPTKRMALKNNITSTMNKEIILVFRNTGGR
jgi:hypothetical protein